MTIKDKVKAAKSELEKMTTHTELRMWAIKNNLDNRSAFANFKKALIEIGINYDNVRAGIKNAEQANLNSKLTHQVIFYSDAKASFGNFAITDKEGDVLWYGRFFPTDNATEQSAAELEAAKKAVWLASKVKEEKGLEAIRLILYVDAQWLTYQSHSGQKGYVLTQNAKKFNIDLKVKWIRGVDNPADEFTTARGFKKWSDNYLPGLAEPLTKDEDEDEEETEEPTQNKNLQLAKAKAAALLLLQKQEGLTGYKKRKKQKN